MDDQSNTGAGQDAPQTTRTVKCALNWNSTTQGLTLQTTGTYTNGTWTTAPPSSIPPTSSDVRDNPHYWRSDGPDAGGQVTYIIGSSSSQLVLSWTSVDGAVNSYTINSTSSNFTNLTVSGNDGVAAEVTYTA